MTKARNIANIASDGSALSDGTINYADITGTPAPFDPDTLAAVAVSGAYADVTGTPAAALPLTGGTVTGNVTLNGALNGVTSVDATTVTSMTAAGVGNDPIYKAVTALQSGVTSSWVVGGVNQTASYSKSGILTTTTSGGVTKISVPLYVRGPSETVSSTLITLNYNDRLTDGGTDIPPSDLITGNYAADFTARSVGDAWSVNYTFATSFDAKGVYFKQFYANGPMTCSAYNGSSWVVFASWDAGADGERIGGPGFSASQYRFDGTLGANAYIVLYEMQILYSPMNLSTAETAQSTVFSNTITSKDSITSYSKVTGATTGWTIQATRDGGSTWTSGSFVELIDVGSGYYLIKTAHDLSGVSAGTSFGTKVIFPLNDTAAFAGTYAEW